MITVLYFGKLIDQTGVKEDHFLELDNTDMLLQVIYKKYPGMNEIPFTLALNEQLIQECKSLQTGDTIALLPPFSGG